MSLQEPPKDWQNWCRLCAKTDADRYVNIFDLMESDTSIATNTWLNLTKDLTLPNALGKFFWINVSRDEELPKVLCMTCFEFVCNLLKFSEHATKVQRMFALLQGTREGCLDLNELRTKFDLPPVSTQSTEPDDTKDVDRSFESLFVRIIEENSMSEEQDAGELAEGCIAYEEECKQESANQDDEEEMHCDEPLEDSPKKEVCTISTKRPRKRATETAKYQCSQCQKSFQRVNNFQFHMKVEHNQIVVVEPIECKECHKQFKSSSALQRHSMNHLPIEQKRTKACPHCTKLFTSDWSVQSHIRSIHTNQPPFICEECGAPLRTSGSLQLHLATHAKEAPYECTECKKCFKNQTHLRKHKDTHDSAKHLCPKCGMQLNSRATLARHLIVHSDVHSHKCDFCGREFKRSKALKSHLILHTGIKPYSCDFCERTFANGSNCRAHKRNVHPAELAALEASGKSRNCVPNIPKLEALKNVTKTSKNLAHVASKRPSKKASNAVDLNPVSLNKPKNSIMQSNDDTSVKYAADTAMEEALPGSEQDEYTLIGDTTDLPTLEQIPISLPTDLYDLYDTDTFSDVNKNIANIVKTEGRTPPRITD